MTKRRIKWGRLLLLLTIVLLLACLYFFSKHGYFALRRMQEKADSLAVMKDSLEIKLEELNLRIELLLQNDPETIEAEARRLGLAKPGEEVIIIQVDSSNVTN